MTDRTNIIALLGRKGSGKSTIANHLKSKYGTETFRFAKQLKLGVADMIVKWPMPPDTPQWRSYVMACMAGQGWTLKPGDVNSALVLMEDAVCKEMPIVGIGVSARWLLQTIGTDVLRTHFGPSVHVLATMRAIDTAAPRVAVIDDMRFVNEAQAVNQCGGTIIKLVCTDDETAAVNTHESERQIDQIEPHLINAVVKCGRSAGASELIHAFDEALKLVLTTRPDLRHQLNAGRI